MAVKKKHYKFSKLFLFLFSALFLVIFSFFIYNFYTSSVALGEYVDKWDGSSVAKSFSGGNGSSDNPYIIKSCEEFIYFKNLIEGDSYKSYKDKYFILENNLDFDNNSINSIGYSDENSERIFNGHLDGNGYSISNLNITGTKLNSYIYYGLFSKTMDASIENLIINNLNINVLDTTDRVIVGSLVAESEISESEEETLSSYSDIVISNFNIDFSNLNSKNNEISGFINTISSKTLVNNIYLKGQISGDNTDNNLYTISNNISSNTNNIISNVSFSGSSNVNLYGKEITATNNFIYTDGIYYLDGEETSINNILINFNDSVNDSFYWEYNDDFTFNTYSEASEVSQEAKSFSFSSKRARSSAITLHDSGISGDSIYVNDLDSDYNYYMGLNYSDYSSSGTIPQGYKQYLYSDSNLVKVYIHYSGVDINDSSLVGYVGRSANSELQSEYYYYKYYPISGSNFTFNLIDNPYSNRPDGKVFNGWVTDYEGATVSINTDTYTRQVSISGVSGGDTISITFYASWIDGDIATVTDSNTSANNINNLISSDLKSGMTIYSGNEIKIYEDVSNYYVSGTVSRNSYYPAGAYNSSGTSVGGNRCSSWFGGCTYYILSSSSTYDSSLTYYTRSGNSFYSHTVTYTTEYVSPVAAGGSAAGSFVQVNVSKGNSISGLYNSDGDILSGTCSSTTCTYYKLLQFYDDDGNTNVFEDGKAYYYLATRDTNILYFTTSTSAAFTVSKPLTITGLNNGTFNSVSIYNTITISNDVRVEQISIKGSSGGTFSANLNNSKFGRHVTIDASNLVYTSTSSSNTFSTFTNYSTIVESGSYATIYGSGVFSKSSNLYIHGDVILGSDYDRVSLNNDNLNVSLKYALGKYVNLYSNSSSLSTSSAIDTVIKSGSFGTEESSELTSGVYLGVTHNGMSYAPSDTIYEGGYATKIIGGFCNNSVFTNYNFNYINIKGGTVGVVFGGASYGASYGNRIISITGGEIENSVFGGSNGAYSTESKTAKLNSSTFIYVGGNALIGSVSDNLIFSYGTTSYTSSAIESGSIFGAGNGKSSSSTVGTVQNSYIVIDGNATINGNVYGGGNYGRVIDSTTSIKVLGGTIKGSVYGGSNNNGAGESDSSNITVNIETSGGTIGNVYGGSRTKGIIYGSTNVNVYGGTILGDVYGGGEGGYSSSSNSGTYVQRSVNVTIGKEWASNSDVTVKGSVYGGSAFGTVNAINENTTTSSYETNVLINSGVINSYVFGGGKGSSDYTPKSIGNITVTVKNGSIGELYGGFNAAGKFGNNSTDIVYLYGGVIGDCYGGGNQVSQTTTDIRLLGSTINNLYGGSNLKGKVTTSNVTVTSGSVNDIYGGNNEAGTTVTTNVSVDGGTINGDIYGGGNKADGTTSNVTVKKVSVNNLYGGGKQAGLTTSNVNLTGTTGNYAFGGSNVSGDVSTTNVKVNSIKFSRLYGGNNQGGISTDTNVDVTNSTISYVFGGGDNAESGTSHVIINSGNIIELYGGGNEAGLTTSNVNVLGGTITNVYGGSNKSGDIETSNVTIDSDSSSIEPYTVTVTYTKKVADGWMNVGDSTYAKVNVTIKNNTSSDITDWSVILSAPETRIFANYSSTVITEGDGYLYFDSVNRWYGYNTLAANGGTYSFDFEIVSDVSLDTFDIDDYANIYNVYGGNNQGGTVGTTNVTVNSGIVSNVYGGGNNAVVTETNVKIGEGTVDTVFGGGNLAKVNSNTNVNLNKTTITTNLYGGGNKADVGGNTNVTINDATIGCDLYAGGNAAGVSGNTLLDVNNSSVLSDIFGGGNEGIVSKNTDVYVTDTSVSGNVYAGGNGASAIVYGDSSVTIDGSSEIGTDSSEAPNEGCIFGSGNAASTGDESVNNSTATVNIVGGIIHGNVYGGPKMAVVYGVTETNIGTDAVNNSKLKEDNIIISGTVFGGGESNANGSETYDWTFISVTNGITVNINGNKYIDNSHDFTINGSIFGSGNASSSSGSSEIYVSNLGTKKNPNKSISIQRANSLVIDSSVIELIGTTDRTNEYSDILYSFNMIDKLVIKNNTTLLLQHNANMLKELYSGVDTSDGLTSAVVDIDTESGSITKNVDNRIYMLPGQNLNVTINQAATVYGKVTGMTFFGMYQAYSNGSYGYGLYDSSVGFDTEASAGLAIVGGSYVVGLHSVNHDITKDGFYSNYLSDDYSSVSVDYIDPSTIGETGYRWIIGYASINYNFTLTASKYSSFGTYELQLSEFADGNTSFNIVGFNSEGLSDGVNLVDSESVPRIGKTDEEANKILGLSMKSETQEWTSYCTTNLLSTGTGVVDGDTYYRTDSRELAPSLMFYFYHAKNISTTGNLGTVIIMMQAVIPKNAVEDDIEFITITIDLVAKQYDDVDSYDASITYDKRYSMPSATLVNITNQSQLTTYFSLISFNDDYKKVYGKNYSNYHVLVTNNPLPLNTMITMMDFGASEDSVEYYYLTITEDIYNKSVLEYDAEGEVTYRLSDFIKMGSTSSDNTYDEVEANKKYFNDELDLVDEEFMFIFDFKDTNVTGTHLNNTILFELRNSSTDREVFSVLGIRQSVMTYNTYESSNIVLSQTISNNDSYLYYDITDEIDYQTNILYNQTENRQSVIDTNYESSAMGLNISFYNTQGTSVSSSMLMGTTINVDGVEYFADSDGVYRIKLAGKVSNLVRTVSITPGNGLPFEEYTVRFTLFASSDGLHNSNVDSSVYDEYDVVVVNSDNSISVDSADLEKIIDGETLLNLNNSNTNTYLIKYVSNLSNPNLRVELYKRNVDDINSTTYESVPITTLFSNYHSFSALSNEVKLDMDGSGKSTVKFLINDSGITSGSYRLVFRLYDNNQLIDDDVKNLIVKKNLIE